MAAPYTHHNRPSRKKNHYIFYCQFRDRHGRRGTVMSTGKTTKGEAERWATEKLKKGTTHLRRSLRFAAYTKNWFDWDESAYITRKRKRGALSHSAVDNQAQLLHNHINPSFKDMLIDRITSEEIEDWLIQLADKKSPATANRSLSVLKVIFKEAQRLGHIAISPATNIEKLHEPEREKDYLTGDEVDELFTWKNFDFVWGGDLNHYLINALGSTTGMRMGEIQALRWEDIYDGHIHVNGSWDRKYGIVPPKAKSKRWVPLITPIEQALQRLKSQSLPAPHNSDNTFIFSNSLGTKPVDHKLIAKRLYAALSQIGIDERERRKRNITFHSWRHAFNTNLLGKVSEADLRRVIGHRTTAMTDHYDHLTKQSVERLKEVILFSA